MSARAWTSRGLLPAPPGSNLDDWQFTLRALAVLDHLFALPKGGGEQPCVDTASLMLFRAELAAIASAGLMSHEPLDRCRCGALLKGVFSISDFGYALLRVARTPHTSAHYTSRISALAEQIAAATHRGVDIAYDRVRHVAEALRRTDDREFVAASILPMRGCPRTTAA